MLLKAPFKLPLNTSRGEHPQFIWATCSIASSLPSKDFPPCIYLCLPSFSLKQLFLVPLLHSLIKNSSPAFLVALFSYWNISHEPSLLQTEQLQLLQLVFTEKSSSPCSQQLSADLWSHGISIPTSLVIFHRRTVKF